MRTKNHDVRDTVAIVLAGSRGVKLERRHVCRDACNVAARSGVI
jgi:hypothetical protein